MFSYSSVEQLRIDAYSKAITTKSAAALFVIGCKGRNAESRRHDYESHHTACCHLHLSSPFIRRTQPSPVGTKRSGVTIRVHGIVMHISNLILLSQLQNYKFAGS
jgi:hypothetical protein